MKIADVRVGDTYYIKDGEKFVTKVVVKGAVTLTDPMNKRQSTKFRVREIGVSLSLARLVDASELTEVNWGGATKGELQ